MSESDSLRQLAAANAARAKVRTDVMAAATPPSVMRRRSHVRGRGTGIALVFVVGVLVGGGLVHWWSRPSIESIRNAFADDAKRDEAQPGFSISRIALLNGEPANYYGWEIRNDAPEPLTIYHVVYNGEFEAKPAKVVHRMLQANPKAPMPIRLTIGESQPFLQHSYLCPEASYRKDVIYIDVYTDRGHVRQGDGGLHQVPSE